jgi:hypothetical protein
LEPASNLTVRSNLMVDDARSRDLRRFLPGDFRADVYPDDFDGPVLFRVDAPGRPTDLQIIEFKQYLRCKRCRLPCAGTCVDEPRPQEEAEASAESKKDSAIMRPERREPPYRAYAVSKGGSRAPISANEIHVELGPGLEIQIGLVPHPNHRGGLPLRAGRLDETSRGVFSGFLIVPGAANVIHLYVQRQEGGSAEKSEADE